MTNVIVAASCSQITALVSVIKTNAKLKT